MNRALQWGVKTVKGRVLETQDEPTMKFEDSPLAKYFNLTVAPESNSEDIALMQELLAKVDAYD